MALYCRYCCCAFKKCNGVVLALCCASCFFCSLFDACCSCCRKNIQCGTRTICRRPPSIVVGLFLRLFVREAVAAAGPLLVVYYEAEISAYFNATSPQDKFLVIILSIVGASLAAYLLGALIGVWIEALFVCSARCCCPRSVSDYSIRPTTAAADTRNRNESARQPAVTDEIVLLQQQTNVNG